MTRQIAGVDVSFVGGRGLASVTLKVDISDIDEDHINSLSLYCKILPRLGGRNSEGQNYDEFLNKYLSDLELEFSTVKHNQGLKLYLFIKVKFLEDNMEFAFNALNNCLNHPHFGNLGRISEIVMAESSNLYNSISEEFLLYGSSYACSEINPFLKLEDRLFHVTFD